MSGLAVVVIAGCGSDDGAGGVKIVATTGIAADVVRNVVGDDADVVQLVPDAESPHHYAASAKDRAGLEEADLVVRFGDNVEESLSLEGADAPVVALGEAVDEDDGHVWMDPTLIAEALPALAEELGDVDPDNQDAYERRASAYARRLRSLDGDLKRTLAAVPQARRKLVTSHESLNHFARRYGFEFVGAPFGLSPEAEASAAAVADLVKRVEREHVPAVFAEREDDPEVMRQIAREAGVRVVDDLVVEGLAPEARTYEEALRYDARLIAGALSP